MQVTLHVYDITNTSYDQANKVIKNLNAFTRQLNIGGMFHGGIEVNGQEWSFGYCPTGTGVYCCRPKSNPMYTYRESTQLGSTTLTPQELHELIRKLKVIWQGHTYDLLQRNCCHFCEDFARELKVDPVPGWLNRFAEASDATVTFFQSLWGNLSRVGAEIVTELQNLRPPGSGTAGQANGPSGTPGPTTGALPRPASQPAFFEGSNGGGPSTSGAGLPHLSVVSPSSASASSLHQNLRQNVMFASLPTHSISDLAKEDANQQQNGTDTPPKENQAPSAAIAGGPGGGRA